MKYFDRITEKLQKNFSPSYLEVVDESESHAGHSGALPGGETHFKVKMSASAFIGLTRIQQQRLVYSVLKTELEDRVHALVLELSIP